MGVERIGGVVRAQVQPLYERECAAYVRARPRSQTLIGQGASGYYAGVPLHWMLDWPMPFPMVVAVAQGATLTDVDGIELADFCLGDTGAMFGHSPPPVVRALARQVERGLTFMLPTQDTLRVGPLLTARFGLPYWQIATTASDANRFALRVARAVTGRPRIVVMNGCYHGAVDETYVVLEAGRAVNKPSLIGQFVDLTQETRVVEFNDSAGLERALAARDVACVITEPVLTNCGMVLPQPGYHEELRRLTRVTGTLLLIDETHTISSGPRGYAGAHGLQPDIFVLGKPVAGGVPASVWGFTTAVAEGWAAASARASAGHSGLGTTLSANALALAGMHATLTEVMTDAAYAHMDSLAARLEAGLAAAVAGAALPWHIVRAGARVEFICAPGPLRNGADAAKAHLPALERAIHVGLINRGCLIAPFHNMMLICPATSSAQVDRLIGAFGELAGELAGRPEAVRA
jgi:glutamate-1-semialdehyde 2,1-aminomutase